MPPPFGRGRRVREHLFQPRDEIALVHGEFAADADGSDAVHQVDGLTLLQAEEGLDAAAAEEGNGFGRARLGRIPASL